MAAVSINDNIYIIGVDDRKNNQFHHVISNRLQSNTYDKHSHWASSSSHPYKRLEATIYEDGSALDKLTFNAINYVRNPEIWLSACKWYTLTYYW
jgi:hypothetical protein